MKYRPLGIGQTVKIKRQVKEHGGKVELKGGSEEDRVEAQKWIDMFLSNAAGRT